ncbi:integrase, partial [Pseudomonas sp. C2B4]|nr:integrase [Pseudomonas sp. C2B4]
AAPYRKGQVLHSVFAAAKLESTVRYLGIEVDDALEMAEQTEI